MCETDNAATALQSDRRNASRAASTRPTATSPLVFTFRLRVRTASSSIFLFHRFSPASSVLLCSQQSHGSSQNCAGDGGQPWPWVGVRSSVPCWQQPVRTRLCHSSSSAGNRIHQGKLYRAYKFVCWMNMWRECEKKKKKWAKADQAAEAPRSSEMQFTQW